MTARIYQPAKTAMQSGRAKTGGWLLEFEPASARQLDPLMGWTSSDDSASQVRLSFDSRQAAVDFAERQGLDYSVREPRLRKPQIKAYADNFRFDVVR
jgi:hypothetical protein|tara:strand:- start:1457 stop:1750 length:294 start_codon:yes stop_codon:yes gene_type:complete